MPCPLETAATATFESLALLFADVPPNDVQREAPLTHAVRVAFAGPVAGALTVAVSDDVAAALAANMLGLDPDAADAALRRDALGELANVVCGNVLPLVAGREAVFHLAAPAAPAGAPLDALVPPADALVLATMVGLEEGRAEMSLVIAGPIPAALATPLAAAGLQPAAAGALA